MVANIWLAASDNDYPTILTHLQSNPTLVNAHDVNGYTPLHAAASYSHLSLLRKLVEDHNGNINVRDYEGDTPLYVVENVETARVMVEELGADWRSKNEEGKTAAEYIEEEGDWPLVAAYLRGLEESEAASSSSGIATGTGAAEKAPVDVQISETEDVEISLPVLDEELKRKIDELAKREDFSGAEAQEELRRLVSQAVKEHVLPEEDRSVRRREGD